MLQGLGTPHKGLQEAQHRMAQHGAAEQSRQHSTAEQQHSLAQQMSVRLVASRPAAAVPFERYRWPELQAFGGLLQALTAAY